MPTLEESAREFCQDGSVAKLYVREGIHGLMAAFHRQQRIVELKDLRGKVEEERIDHSGCQTALFKAEYIAYNRALDVILALIDAEIGEGEKDAEQA